MKVIEGLKKLAGSFIIGGLFGVIGQILFTIYSGMFAPNSPMLIISLLISFGLIGALLFVLKIYQKLEMIGGFGAMLPFSGLASAVAGTVINARNAGGSLRQAIKSGLMLVVIVVGAGWGLSMIVGLIAFFVR